MKQNHTVYLMFILLFTSMFNGCIDEYINRDSSDDDDDKGRFFMSDALSLAEQEARKWADYAYLHKIQSENARTLDGKNTCWNYKFQANSRTRNDTTNVSIGEWWTVFRLSIDITYIKGEFNLSINQLEKNYPRKVNLPTETFVHLSMDSDEAASLAMETSEVQELMKESDDMWVDYRLNNLGWLISVDSVEHDAHIDGIAIRIKIDPETKTVESYREAGGAN